MSQDIPESVENFFQTLKAQGAAELTIRNYRCDLVHFVRWFEGSTEEPFSPAAITPTDLTAVRM
jgi:site-specific recombinase XerD